MCALHDGSRAYAHDRDMRRYEVITTVLLKLFKKRVEQMVDLFVLLLLRLVTASLASRLQEWVQFLWCALHSGVQAFDLDFGMLGRFFNDIGVIQQ